MRKFTHEVDEHVQQTVGAKLDPKHDPVEVAYNYLKSQRIFDIQRNRIDIRGIYPKMDPSNDVYGFSEKFVFFYSGKKYMINPPKELLPNDIKRHKERKRDIAVRNIKSLLRRIQSKANSLRIYKSGK